MSDSEKFSAVGVHVQKKHLQKLNDALYALGFIRGALERTVDVDGNQVLDEEIKKHFTCLGELIHSCVQFSQIENIIAKPTLVEGPISTPGFSWIGNRASDLAEEFHRNGWNIISILEAAKLEIQEKKCWPITDNNHGYLKMEFIPYQYKEAVSND